MKTAWIAAVAIAAFVSMGADGDGCGNHSSARGSSDELQRAQQERILREGTAQTGMPAIKNFRERRLLKSILEMRDQESLTTYTYTYSEMTGRSVFFCDSIGYGIPYATQYTNPAKLEDVTHGSEGIALATLPQADPNGLFSPAAAEGTWVLCKDPAGSDVKPVYVEPRVIVSPFRLERAAAAEKTEKAEAPHETSRR
jgi:hypothetical protein